MAAENTATDPDWSAKYVARRDYEDLQTAIPDLDTRMGNTVTVKDGMQTITLPSEYIDVFKELHAWRSVAVTRAHPELEPGTKSWLHTYSEMFYPKLYDTPITVYRKMTKKLPDSTDPLSVEGGEGSVVGAFWSLNPTFVAQFTPGQDGRMARMTMTFDQLVTCAGNGNDGHLNNNLAFPPGCASVYPGEWAVVLDYRKLPDEVRDTAQFVKAEDYLGHEPLASDMQGLVYDRYLAMRGGYIRQHARAAGLSLDGRIMDDAGIRVGIRTMEYEKTLALEEAVGVHHELADAALAALKEEQTQYEETVRLVAEGVHPAQLYRSVKFQTAELNKHGDVLQAARETYQVSMDEMRSVLVKTGDEGQMCLENYRRARPALQQAIDYIAAHTDTVFKIRRVRSDTKRQAHTMERVGRE